MKLALLIAVTFAPIMCHGLSETAGELKNACALGQQKQFTVPRGTPEKDVPQILMRDAHASGECDGFISGWAQTIVGLRVPSDKQREQEVKFADNVTLGQMVRVFTAYIDKHPEKENEPAVEGLWDAMSDAGLAELTPAPSRKEN